MKIPCPYVGCERFLKSRESFEYHVNIHKNVKPYECQLCTDAFRNASLLKAHNVKAHHRREKVSKSDSSSQANKVSHFTRKSKERESPVLESTNTTSSRKRKSRSLCVQIRPEDLNEVRKHMQLKESVFWKRAMHHLFAVPYDVINPEFSDERKSMDFWHTSRTKPYRGFVPISKLPEELQGIHKKGPDNFIQNRAGNEIEPGWVSALAISAKSKGESLEVPEGQHLTRATNASAAQFLNLNSIFHLDDSGFSESQQKSPNYRTCPYCKKMLAKERYDIHLATHKGHGFRMQKCVECGLRFLNRQRLSDHMKEHSCTPPKNRLYDGMPRLAPINP